MFFTRGQGMIKDGGKLRKIRFLRIFNLLAQHVLTTQFVFPGGKILISGGKMTYFILFCQKEP